MTTVTILPPGASDQGAAPTFADRVAAGTARPDLVAGGWKVDPRRGALDGRVSSEWWHRPEDERYLTLDDLHDAVLDRSAGSREQTVETKQVRVHASRDDLRGLTLTLPGEDDDPVSPTHWSFGQLCSLVGTPTKLRRYPAVITAPALQWDLINHRQELAKVMTTADGRIELRAVTGPDYGRIWDHEVVESVRKVTQASGGTWKVPGTIDWRTLRYDPHTPVTKQSTTLYASDHDIFVFLVDDLHPIEIGKLPDGSPDVVCRGFYVWNSETGARSVGISSFFFRAACQNRCIWGQEGLETVTIRHSKFASDRFARDVTPALNRYANAGTDKFLSGIKAAQAATVAESGSEGDEDRLGFLTDKAGLSAQDARKVVAAVLAEEGHPAVSVWDMIQGLTALARDKSHTDERIELERKAGKLLAKAA